MNVPDVKAQRKKWIENINNYDKEKLVFLDESGVNTDMTRIYGRSKKGTRSVDKTPLNTPANTTILSSVRLIAILKIITSDQQQKTILCNQKARL